MSIIYLLNEESDLERMQQQPYEDEDYAQRLLADYPDLLTGDEASDRRHRWLLVQREMGVPDKE